MTNNELTARVAAILATLEETGGTPESNLYLFFDTNMDAYRLARRLMVDSGLIEITYHWVELTPKGRALAEKINAATKKIVSPTEKVEAEQ